jgi:hypothetical protein
LYFLPGLQDVLFVSLFFAVMLLGPIMLNMDGDLPRHLLTGKVILETKAVPKTEPFAYPYQEKPFISHSHDWLSDSLFYLTYKFSGLPGLVILSALVLAATFSIIYSYTSKQSNLRLFSLFLVVWGAAATSLNWVTRPFLFSMLFLAVWLTWLDKLSRNEKVKLWYFPALIMVWSNMHGEFIAGFLALFAYTAGWLWDYLFDRKRTQPEVGKNLLFVSGFSFLASLINPAGLNPWKTLLGFVNNSYLMSRMYEARQPDFSRPEFLVLLGLLSFSIFLLAAKTQKISTAQAFLLAGFSGMSLIAGRNIHLYGIVAPFVLAGAIDADKIGGLLSRLENTLSSMEQKVKSNIWPFMITLGVSVMVLSSQSLQSIYKFSPVMFPVQATRWLLENPQKGKMFNDINWGGYLALHLWPGQSVFADSMADTTGELTYEYESVLTLSPEWKNILSKYQVDWVVIQTSSELANILEKESWDVIYTDQTATILRK